jgi:hypothetical protein
MAIPNTYNSGVYPQEWATKLQERLDYPQTWKECADVIYSDSYIINFPYMSTAFSAQTGTRGCSYGFSEFALTNDPLTISTFKIVPVFIDQADLAQCKLANQAELATRQASLLNEAIESAFLADAANWTDFGVLSITGSGAATDAITVSASNIDDIIRGIKREIGEANGQNLLDRNGGFIVWRYSDLEYLEQFAQANGFNLADTALKSGVKSGYHFMGLDHYVSNSHTTGHVAAGVKKIEQIGILKSTYGQIKILQDPASGVSTYGPVSGIGVVSRIDYGVNPPAGLTTLLFDVNVA